MALILFVAELGSGFGHVRRLLPIARAAKALGHDARFIVSNPEEVAGDVTSAGFQVAAAPRVSRSPDNTPAPGAVATSFADILGGSGFADPGFLHTICARWDAELAALRPLAVVCESSPFLLLACFDGPIPVLSVGHGFILPPPHLPHFLPLVQGTPLYSEPRLLEHVASVCRARNRVPPSALPMLLAGTTHAVTGLDVLDPYRLERRQISVGPPALDVDLDVHASDEVFLYLLGDSPITLAMLRGLGRSGLRGHAFVRRASVAQRDALAGSGIGWLEQPKDGRTALARSCLVIHHGSMTIAEESLFLGRPQVVAPLYLEHLFTARALSTVGVTKVIRPPHDVSQIAHELAIAYADSSMRDAASQLAHNLRTTLDPSPALPSRLITSVASQNNAELTDTTSRLGASEPIVSFVVPSYQMAPYLALSLESLAALQNDAATEFETVVVDDGSTDETCSVFNAAVARSPDLLLRYVHRPRDEHSCRSLARNLGAAASRGRYLVFLDAGVVAHPQLLNLLLRRWTAIPDASEDVLAVGTLGLFLNQFYDDTSNLVARFQSLSSAALLRAFDELSPTPPWCERRQPWFDFTQGDLSKLPAPWLLAWSCALGVPRHLFVRACGFDETFANWGAEDCDFALRLHESGARFHAFAAPAALHVPHPTEPAAARKRQHRQNIRKMHTKRFGRESELFAVLEDPFAANLLAMRLDHVQLEQLLPSWDAQAVDLSRRLVGTTDDALVVAAPTPRHLSEFSRVTWAVPSRRLFENLGHILSADRVKLTMGCHCDEPTSARRCVVLTDLIRLLPPKIQFAQLQEACRIGQEVYFFCTEQASGLLDESGIHRKLVNWPMSSLDSFLDLAVTAGVTLTRLAPNTSSCRIYSITASSPTQLPRRTFSEG